MYFVFSLHQQRSMSSTQGRKQSISSRTGATEVGMKWPALPLLTHSLIVSIKAHCPYVEAGASTWLLILTWRWQGGRRLSQVDSQEERKQHTHHHLPVKHTHIYIHTQGRKVLYSSKGTLNTFYSSKSKIISVTITWNHNVQTNDKCVWMYKYNCGL